MKLRHALPMLLIASVVTFGLIAGCGQKTDKTKTGKSKTSDKTADPNDMPLTEKEKKELRDSVPTFDKALARIKEFADTIKKETTGGTPAKAHRALDKLDLVLEWLPVITQKSKVPKDQWKTIGSNAQKLRDSFNKVHQKIDDGKAPDYAAVAADIETSIKALEAVKPK